MSKAKVTKSKTTKKSAKVAKAEKVDKKASALALLLSLPLSPEDLRSGKKAYVAKVGAKASKAVARYAFQLALNSHKAAVIERIQEAELSSTRERTTKNGTSGAVWYRVA
jgi:hypothetical protein